MVNATDPSPVPEPLPERGVPVFMNPLARSDGHWSDAQDAILNDRGLDTALQAIRSWPDYAETPLYHLDGLAEALGVAQIHWKDEAPRFGLGSFKALGGAYAVARLIQAQFASALGLNVSMADLAAGVYASDIRHLTVCCATDGNHGRSVAWGAERFGCGCVIFIHATVSEGRKAAIEAFGAQVRRCEGNYDDSVREAQDTAEAEGWFVVSDTSYPGYLEIPKHVMQGYEVMAEEAFAALDRAPTHIFLQTGVGGMAAAVTANAVRRWGAARPKIILCDPDQSACWYDSLRAGRPVAVTGELDTLMAGLACGEVSTLAWEILQSHADAVVALPDVSAEAAMRVMAEPCDGDPALVAGESAVAGLAGLAAALESDTAREALSLGPQARVMLFGTEGDTDPELYEQIVGRPAAAVYAQG